MSGRIILYDPTNIWNVNATAHHIRTHQDAAKFKPER